MNKIQTFEQFLNSSSAEFSILNFLLNLILTAILSKSLAVLYNKYGNSLSNRKSFASNFVMLSATTMIIITIVKSSLALSLGLVGALSIVRFRAAIKEPEELTYLFLNIAIGLGFGADQRAATIAGFLFLASYLFINNRFFSKKQNTHQGYILNIRISNPAVNQLEIISNILKKFMHKVELKRFDENDNNIDTSFIIEVLEFNQLIEAKAEIQKQIKEVSISFLDNNLSL